MKEEWVLSIKRQTEVQGAAFFFKQWGTWGQMVSNAINTKTEK
jgi:protein gp37